MFKTKGKIILASNSPRRKELLASVGVVFDVVAANVDETLGAEESPTEHVERLSLDKAKAVAGDYPDAFVIGADTIVLLDGVVMGKPKDVSDAKDMLQRLSGKTHSVITGYAVVSVDLGIEVSGFSETRVTMKELEIAEIGAYVATKEPMDKAGAYAIQGYASSMVVGISGSYSNVVGLPLTVVVGQLLELGALEFSG